QMVVRHSRLHLAIEVLTQRAGFFADPLAQLGASHALALELVRELQRGEHGDGLQRRSLGAPLNFLDAGVHLAGQRLDVRVRRVALDGVLLTGDGDGHGPLQRVAPPKWLTLTGACEVSTETTPARRPAVAVDGAADRNSYS